MEKPLPLTWIDREIFLELVRQHGIKSVKKQLSYSKSFKHAGNTIQSNIYYPVTVSIEIKIDPKTSGHYTLYKMVHEAITLKEKKQQYCSQDTYDEKDNIIRRNNFLGNYTEYWHKEDQEGNYYIQCKSEFTNKNELLCILKGIKEKNFTIH
jgi:hypothetical protein